MQTIRWTQGSRTKRRLRIILEDERRTNHEGLEFLKEELKGIRHRNFRDPRIGRTKI